MGCKFKNRCPSYSVWCEGIDYPGENCILFWNNNLMLTR